MTVQGRAKDDGQAHVDPVVLMDYWLAALSAAEEETVEEHLLACDGCGDRLRDVMQLAESLHELARSGTLQVIVDDDLLRRAEANGLRIREYGPPRGESIQCTVTAEDDLLIARLALTLSTATRIDLSWRDLHGVERQRMTDIPIRADAGSVICQQSIIWAKESPTTSRVAQLVAVDEQGHESVLGEFTFHHTRTIPGPPGWTEP